MRKRPRVVIAGLGDTGTLVAVHLGRSFDVVGIATRPALVSGQEVGNRVADPDRWRRNFLLPFSRFERLDPVRTVHGRITGVDPVRRVVHVELARGGRAMLSYDVLVVSCGVSNGFWRQDRVEDLPAVEAGLAAVADQLAAAGSIAVVGGGATGVSAAVSLARRHRLAAVHLFHSGDEPLPGYHPRARRRIVTELERAGVIRHPGHRAAVPEGFRIDRLTTEPVAFSTGQPDFEADAVLWAVGAVRPNSDALPASMLDEHGFVRVDEHLAVPGHPGVFAVGDIAASDPHRSSARNWGYLVVAHNIKVAFGGGVGPMWSFRPPEHRWGSILGQQDDGMLVFRPDGRALRVPPWAVQPLLFRLWMHVLLYRGLRPDRGPGAR